jgi:LemA protein
MNFYWYLIIAILAIISWLIFIFNRLILFKNRTNEAWSDIDIQLKRRHDLIPNLIETVKGYAAHEREIFEKVSVARSGAIAAQNQGLPAIAAAEQGLGGALRGLLAVAENYPQLQASANFLSLQQELVDTENKIQAARRFYNGNARDFNVIQEIFPSNIVASLFKFQKVEFFEIENPEEKEAPEVKF